MTNGWALLKQKVETDYGVTRGRSARQGPDPKALNPVGMWLYPEAALPGKTWNGTGYMQD